MELYGNFLWIHILLFSIFCYCVVRYCVLKVLCPSCGKRFFVNHWWSFPIFLNFLRVPSWYCVNCNIPIGSNIKNKIFKKKKKTVYFIEKLCEMIFCFFLIILTYKFVLTFL